MLLGGGHDFLPMPLGGGQDFLPMSLGVGRAFIPTAGGGGKTFLPDTRPKKHRPLPSPLNCQGPLRTALIFYTIDCRGPLRVAQNWDYE